MKCFYSLRVRQYDSQGMGLCGCCGNSYCIYSTCAWEVWNGFEGKNRWKGTKQGKYGDMPNVPKAKHAWHTQLGVVCMCTRGGQKTHYQVINFNPYRHQRPWQVVVVASCIADPGWEMVSFVACVAHGFGGFPKNVNKIASPVAHPGGSNCYHGENCSVWGIPFRRVPPLYWVLLLLVRPPLPGSMMAPNHRLRLLQAARGRPSPGLVCLSQCRQLFGLKLQSWSVSGRVAGQLCIASTPACLPGLWCAPGHRPRLGALQVTRDRRIAVSPPTSAF